MSDTLETLSPLARSPLRFCDGSESIASYQAGAICLAIDRSGELPPLDPNDFDVMLTITPNPPAPWVSIAPTHFERQLRTIQFTGQNFPIAASVLSQVLRINETLGFEAALEVESLAYSTLLGGREFANWLASNRAVDGPLDAIAPGDLVRYERFGDQVTLTLSSPWTRNAMNAAMRDSLYEALANLLDDPSKPDVLLRADGKCFSTGGDLREFGSARDLAEAHVIRTARSCARLLHRLGPRATVHLHGACIGSGLEVPVAAGNRIASPNMFAQLPELRMGLIPGAGGTVTLSNVLGRHRTMWMALTGARLRAETAMQWGLVERIGE